VGLLGKPGGGGCSAVLIENDLVLTAGHCVTGAKGDGAAELVFRPSTAALAPGTPYPGRFVTLHPTWLDFATVGTDGTGTIARDIALFRLAASVDPDEALPIAVGAMPAEPDRLTLVSFRGGKPPLMVRDCPVRRLDPDLFWVDCPVRSGESGAPAFAEGADGPVVVGIVSRQSRGAGIDAALGAVLGDAYRLLRAAEPPLNDP
jgi:protease YdgD